MGSVAIRIKMFLTRRESTIRRITGTHREILHVLNEERMRRERGDVQLANTIGT
jgi:hypothetical protein